MSENRGKIVALVAEYSVLIGRDHHKHEDGKFSIEAVWDAYAPTRALAGKFTAVHQGYCHEYEPVYRNTYEEAERDLIEFLKYIIKLETESGNSDN